MGGGIFYLEAVNCLVLPTLLPIYKSGPKKDYSRHKTALFQLPYLVEN